MFNVPNRTFQASGDINPSRFVNISGEFTVAEADAAEVCHGISHESTKSATSSLAAASGDPIAVYGPGQECLLTAGGTVTAGELLKSDADGKGVTATIEEAGALALQSGASGELIKVRVLQARVDLDVS